jgi:hypothetical protein
VVLDGTKVRANASKHRAMSYGRMKKKKEELEKGIEALLKDAEAVDKEEDKKYGKGKKGWELPDELKRRETRLAKIKDAAKALEDEARQQESQNPKPAKAAANEPPSSPAAPADKAQRNFPDPDSRIMKLAPPTLLSSLQRSGNGGRSLSGNCGIQPFQAGKRFGRG